MPQLQVPAPHNSGREAVPVPAFACVRRKVGRGVGWVHVAGERDLATTPELARALREEQAGARSVVLDLRAVTFIDSSAVHVNVDAGIRARRDGCRLVIPRGPPCVDRIFVLTASAGDVEMSDLAPHELGVALELERAHMGVAA